MICVFSHTLVMMLFVKIVSVCVLVNTPMTWPSAAIAPAIRMTKLAHHQLQLSLFIKVATETMLTVILLTDQKIMVLLPRHAVLLVQNTHILLCKITVGVVVILTLELQQKHIQQSQTPSVTLSLLEWADHGQTPST